MSDTTTSKDVTAQEERRSAWKIIKNVIPYLWPDSQKAVKARVVLALVLLVVAKIVAIVLPLLQGAAVDSLSGITTDFILGAVGITLAYGIARILESGFQELRDAVFAPVGQRALRLLALETFRHIHSLSMRYHITRKTGGLSRIVERGVKGVDFLLRQ